MYEYLVHIKVMFAVDSLLDSTTATNYLLCQACMTQSRFNDESCIVEAKPTGPIHRPAS